MNIKDAAVDNFFDSNRSSNNVIVPNDDSAVGKDLPGEIFQATFQGEDAAFVRTAGLYVHDDNDPPPENVSGLTPSVVDEGTWGWNDADNRASFGDTNDQSHMNTLRGMSLKFTTHTSMCLTFFPVSFFENIVMVQINKQLDVKLTFGELL